MEHPGRKSFRTQNHHWTPARFPPEGLVKLFFALKMNIIFHACRNSTRLLLQHIFQPEICQITNVRTYHLEQPLGYPECPLSDSECIWKILARNISGPRIIILGRDFFHHGGLPVARSRDLDNPKGSCFREMKIHTQPTMEKYLGPK